MYGSPGSLAGTYRSVGVCAAGGIYLSTYLNKRKRKRLSDLRLNRNEMPKSLGEFQGILIEIRFFSRKQTDINYAHLRGIETIAIYSRISRNAVRGEEYILKIFSIIAIRERRGWK